MDNWLVAVVAGAFLLGLIIGIARGAIKITVSRYFTPRGTCIHKEGITPDVEVDLNEELKTKLTIEKSEDNQLQKAIENVKEQIAAE